LPVTKEKNRTSREKDARKRRRGNKGSRKNKETRQLEAYHNQLLDTLNDAGLVKRIREEERRLNNAATAPTPPTPLHISPATVTPQVKRNALAPQASRTQEPQRTELQQAGNETEPESLSMIMDLPPQVELPPLPPLPADKQSDQHGEEGNTREYKGIQGKRKKRCKVMRLPCSQHHLSLIWM
jgi:hypothetical protein